MGLAKWTVCAGAGAIIALFLSGRAFAQSPATCSFDSATGTVTVTVNGQTANLNRTANGAIQLNNTSCGGATATTTERIVLAGGALNDVVMMTGNFAPGRTAETGVSEIEVEASEIQNLTLYLGGADDVVILTTGGVDMNGDGDNDITGVVPQSVRSGGGDDFIDFSLSTNPVSMYGAAGNDHLIGGSGNNFLSGQADDDTLEGNGGNDRFEGGPGNDIELGGDGNDTFTEGPTANGADLLDGGNNTDIVQYTQRTRDVTVTLDDGADDGEAGEGDEIVGVENAEAGSGDDLLVGQASINILEGGEGDDDLFGGGNNDQLFGGPGNDYLQGDQGRNQLRGEDGDDTLVGDPTSDDRFFGGEGNDRITGTADGIVENVDCGGGQDTAEASAEDRFLACEIL